MQLESSGETVKANHRFLRHHDGLPSFARVGLSSEPASAWEVTFDAALGDVVRWYGEAIQSGIRAAAAAHERAGGECQRVHVELIEHTPVDTTPEAMECASAVAAWASFGRAESEAQVSHEDGRWTVRFETARPRSTSRMS